MKPLARVEHVVTPEDYEALCAGAAVGNPVIFRRVLAQSRRNALLTMAVVGALVIGLAYARGGGREALIGAGLFAVIVLVFVLPRLTRASVRRRMEREARRQARAGASGAAGPAALTIYEDRLEEERAGATTSRPWSEARSMWPTPEGLYVEFEGGLSVLPRSAFEEQAEFDRVAGLIAGRVTQALARRLSAVPPAALADLISGIAGSDEAGARARPG